MPNDLPLPSALSTPAHPSHTWRFFSAGGFTQVRLDRGQDLARIGQLDQKLWVALSCPTQGLEFDARTLALLDGDQDGHIRAPELIAAMEWVCARLQTPDTLLDGGDLPLEAISTTHPDGPRLQASARQILNSLGKAASSVISVDDTADSAAIFAGMPFNGDGVITAASVDPEHHGCFADLLACSPSLTDRSGAPGVDQAGVETFFADVERRLAWLETPQHQADCLPLGEATEAAYAALSRVQAKIDDYFTRCRMAAFDPRAGELLNAAGEQLRALSSRALVAGDDDVAALPIAFVKNTLILPLTVELNPAWEIPMQGFVAQLVRPCLGACEGLAYADWEALKARFAPYAAWQAARPLTVVDVLGLAELRAYRGAPARQALLDAIDKDRARAPEADAIADVERLVRYTRDLAKLANNFVAFRDFYTRQDKAVFQVGTLYLDGRSADLCLNVLDAGKHAALASLSGIYLAYCDCVRKGEKMTIAAAFTAGDADQLMVGRNGVFYDRAGRDWDATITKIVDHPISIRQAFWSPYKKLVRLIAEQAQKLAAARAKASDDLLTGSVSEAEKKLTAGKAAAPAPVTPPSAFDVGKFAGIFAALGLAAGALGTALASVVTGFLGLKGWQMPLALAGLMLMISGPAMALAFFKLRNRNLGPLLDANGWAVNTRARINIPFGTALTQTAKLPEGAERALSDPYAEKSTPWGLYLLVAAIVLAGVMGVAR